MTGMKRFSVLIFLTLVHWASAEPDEAAIFRGYFKEWAECHPSMPETPPAMAAASIKKCTYVKSHNCFAACYLQNLGILQDGGENYNEPKVKEYMNSLVNPEHKEAKATVDMFVGRSKKCWDKVKEKGGTIPTTFENDAKCQSAEDLLQCIRSGRNCS